MDEIKNIQLNFVSKCEWCHGRCYRFFKCPKKIKGYYAIGCKKCKETGIDKGYLRQKHNKLYKKIFT